MLFSRVFAMPNSETFKLNPVKTLLHRYLHDKQIIVDPFARNSSFGTLTNDLNPRCTAQYSLKAEDFVEKFKNIQADVVLFDPPYSPRQIQECYQNCGLIPKQSDTQNAKLYKTVKNGLDRMLKPGGLAISCGWNSNGFGKKRRYTILEILLVAHGSAHNDTIILVEQKPLI